MPRSTSDIITAIRAYQPTEGNWLALDKLMAELFQSDSPSDGVDAMLSIFERYPTEDGCGVFWSILHGLESLPGYESNLVESVRRAPSRFSLMMVNRLLNSGLKEVSVVPLVSLLERVAQDPNCDSRVRESARKFLDHQRAN